MTASMNIPKMDNSVTVNFVGGGWEVLSRETTETITYDPLQRAAAEDPFATTNLGDCSPELGITPSALVRFEGASAAFSASCLSPGQDDDKQEILRLSAAYWLKKSGTVGLN